MQTRTTTVEGVPMRWEEAGEGLPLVLVHGIPTCPALWRHVVPYVRGARCLAWEMVGYGESIPAGRGRDISVGRQAEYLAGWLRALGIEHAVLAGHDLGGGVVQIVAVRHPELCAGLFLTNAIGYDSWPILSVKAMRATSGVLRRLPNALLRSMMATLYRRGHDDRRRADEALELHWPHYARHGAGETLARQTSALDVQDTLAIANDLPGLRVPARIVWGAADQFQKLHYGERFARDLNAPLTRIDGGRHFTPEDHPETVARALNQLLDEVRARHPATGAESQPAAEDLDARLERGMAVIPSLPEVMPDDADTSVRGIYEDIQATLRVPFVNLLFRLLASDPRYLAAAWAYAGPVARTQVFERAADALRAQALLEPVPDTAGVSWERLGDVSRIRPFTDAIHYALPKLLLVATLLDPATRAGAAGPAAGRAETIPHGIAEGTEKIGMVDPKSAAEPLRSLFDDIRDHHRHPAVATYFRSLGHWPDLLQAVWTRLRPLVGAPAYEARKAALIAQAVDLAASLRGQAGADGAIPEPPEALIAALAVFRRRLIPDLLLDVTLVKAMLDGPDAARSNRFSVTEAG